MGKTCRYILVFLLLWSLAISGVAMAADGRRIVAVMEIEDNSGRLSKEDVNAATDYLRGRLTTTGKYIVIDKTRQAAALKKVVRGSKAESYKECRDTACQIPLGQVLSADYILRTSIIYLGGVYSIQAELVDLSKEAAVRGAMVDFEEKPGVPPVRGLVGVLKNLVAQLVIGGGFTPVAAPAVVAPPPAPVPAPTPQSESDDAQSAEPAPEPETEGVEASADAEASSGGPHWSSSTGGWLALVAGTAITGGGVYFINKAHASNATLDEDLQDPAFPKEQAQSDFQDASNNNTLGLFMVGAGATAIIGAIVLFATNGDSTAQEVSTTRKYRARSSSPGGILPIFSMTPHGASVSLGGRF